jgi:hypothetical protein
VLLAQKIEHAAPVAALLGQAFSTLRSEPHGVELALAVIEIVASALLVISLVRAFRAVGKAPAHAPHHRHIDWVDLSVAGVLAVEALERWHSKHRIAGPTILTAVVLVVLGLFHDRIGWGSRRRRTLRAGDDELYIGGRPFMAFRAKWNEIASIDVADRWATVRTRSGRQRRLDLSDLDDAAAVRQVLEVARARVEAAQ